VPVDPTQTHEAVATLARAHVGLSLLVLHGSRARGDARPDSDWDFAYLASAAFDPSLLHADLALSLGSDRIDLVDLTTAGGLIRYRAARDGIVLFEAAPGTFDRFWFESVSFWCDAESVLRAGYASILKDLGP
jgi:predicted nucleotidyltransferase